MDEWMNDWVNEWRNGMNDWKNLCTCRVFGPLILENGQILKTASFSREHCLKVTYVDTFFQVDNKNNGYVLCSCQLCQPPAPLPTCVQTDTSKSALLASMWLGMKPSWPSYFHNVLVERWHGHRSCDGHAAINMWQISLYIALHQSTSKAAAHDVEHVLVSMHDWMHDLSFRCLRLASDSSSRIQIRNFPHALKPCPRVTHGTTHNCLMHGTICGNTPWQK